MVDSVNFRCRYDLDQRVDAELVNLTQSCFHLIQDALKGGYATKIKDGLPDPVEFYLLYTAALMYGAADAAVTLILHNLGRDAKVLERQMFEYLVRSLYYANNPDEAGLAIFSTPFQEKRLLDELGYDKHSPRYQGLIEMCAIIKPHHPEAEKYREPSLRIILSSVEDPEIRRFYALHYRVASQMLHATLAGTGGVWGDSGISFDSRLTDPNYSLEFMTAYLLAFLDLMSERLQINIAPQIGEAKSRWEKVESKLTRHRREELSPPSKPIGNEKHSKSVSG